MGNEVFTREVKVSTITSISGALPAGDNNIGNVDVVTLPAIDLVGYTGVEVIAAGAGDEAVAVNPGKVAAIYAEGADVVLKDGVTNRWKAKAGGGPFPPVPITCATNITLTFSAAGTAYIVYKEG